MKKEKAISISLAVMLFMGLFSSVSAAGEKAAGLADIQYEPSRYQNPMVSPMIQVTGVTHGKTGQAFTATASCTMKSSEHIYYLFDWGDGTWSYSGPVLRSVPLSLDHVYKKAGNYEVRAMSIVVAKGTKSGFCSPISVKITGDEAVTAYIENIHAISSSDESDTHSAANIIDGANTCWQPEPSADLYASQWVGLLLDDYHVLDTLEVKIPADCPLFPQNIAIEYTTDGGEIWYNLPKYYYKENHQEGRFNPLMGLPNPQGATLSFALDGICANGIRIASKLYPVESAGMEKFFQVEEMRVTGHQEPLYYSSLGGRFDADLNNMYTIYGTAHTEPRINGIYWGNSMGPYEGGATVMTVTEWFEWDSLQMIWTNFTDGIAAYTARLFATRIGEDTWGNDGFIWADIAEPKHMGHQAHYDNNAIYIIAARDYLLQRNDRRNVLKIRNLDGYTMEEIIDRAMAYQLGPLEGSTGLITIRDPQNDGTLKGNASSYWDAFTADGYQSAFVNIMFYKSLLAMADIALWRDDAAASREYLALAARTKERFNDTFWDAEKGRYIMSIDANGEKHDYGTTYMNVSAVAYGIADEEKARMLYAWLDGERVIEGDTSTGEDIYALEYAPRANTLDIAAIGPPYYWEDWVDSDSPFVSANALSPAPDGNARFGYSIQNGGAIFYTSYFDVMGRIKALGADDGLLRFCEILDAFHQDQLRRRVILSVATRDGILGEFPESGIVPLAFQNGFIGIQTAVNGILVSPNLPGEMSSAGISAYYYDWQRFQIEVNREVAAPETSSLDDRLYVRLPAEGTYLIHTDGSVETIAQ